MYQLVIEYEISALGTNVAWLAWQRDYIEVSFGIVKDSAYRFEWSETLYFQFNPELKALNNGYCWNIPEVTTFLESYHGVIDDHFKDEPY